MKKHHEIGKPLDCGMDNVLAWRLGEVASNPQLQKGGYLIDRGLILRRLLEEKGFSVHQIIEQR